MSCHFTHFFILCLFATFATSCSKSTPEPVPATENSVQTAAPADNAAAQTSNAPKTEAQTADENSLPMTLNKRDEKDWGFIQTATNSLRNDLTLSFEIPVFNEKVPGYQKINDVFQNRRTAFFNKDAVTKRWDFNYLDEINHDAVMQFEDSFTADVKLVSDKYVSVLLMYSWFAGGVNDYGYETYLFDAQTGDPVTLDKYLNKDFETTKASVKEGINTFLAENQLAQDTIEWKTFENMTDFKFIIENGKTLVMFSKYEIADGATGGIIVELK